MVQLKPRKKEKKNVIFLREFCDRLNFIESPLSLESKNQTKSDKSKMVRGDFLAFTLLVTLMTVLFQQGGWNFLRIVKLLFKKDYFPLSFAWGLFKYAQLLLIFQKYFKCKIFSVSYYIFSLLKNLTSAGKCLMVIHWKYIWNWQEFAGELWAFVRSLRPFEKVEFFTVNFQYYFVFSIGVTLLAL